MYWNRRNSNILVTVPQKNQLKIENYSDKNIKTSCMRMGCEFFCLLIVIFDRYLYCRGPGSSVDVATDYGLDVPGIESW